MKQLLLVDAAPIMESVLAAVDCGEAIEIKTFAGLKAGEWIEPRRVSDKKPCRFSHLYLWRGKVYGWVETLTGKIKQAGTGRYVSVNNNLVQCQVQIS